MESLSAANTQFSLNVFKKISEINTSGNVFYSPLSISSALAMVSLGAEGNTKDQILQVLCLNKLLKPEAATPAPGPTVLPQTQKPKTSGCCEVKREPPVMPQAQKPKTSGCCEVKHVPPVMPQAQKPKTSGCCEVKHVPPVMPQAQKPKTSGCGKVQHDPPVMPQAQKPKTSGCCEVKREPPVIPQAQKPKTSGCCEVKREPPVMSHTLKPQISVCCKVQHDPPVMPHTLEPEIYGCSFPPEPPMMPHTLEPEIYGCSFPPEPPMMPHTLEPEIYGCSFPPEPPMMPHTLEPEIYGCSFPPEPPMMPHTLEPEIYGCSFPPEPPMMPHTLEPEIYGCSFPPEPPMMPHTLEPEIYGCRIQPEPPMMPVMPQAQKSPAQPTHGNKTEDQIHSSYNKLMSELNKPGVPYMLSLANRLYGEKSYQFIDKFISNSQKYYQAGLESVDFIKNSEAARVNINNWVEKNTQGKIKDLLAQGIVKDLTRLVLVNAIYFKGNWEQKFRKEATVDVQFQVNKNETKKVKMMNQRSEFFLNFIPEVNSQILELPYVGNNLSMFIILPNEIEDDTTGLQKLEKTLTYEKLMEWTKPDKMNLQYVQISLPKFKLEETYDMKNLLVKLGMVDAFEMGKANFSGMSHKNDLMISKVIHKSFVEVNEDGTEVAAAPECCRPAEMFSADHPFLFFIRHNPTNTILFYGRFCSP
nr:leukocyte elastase inhibitor-like [Misgurnus anguillicaudatus]